jgi:hypothetical protein
MQLMGDVMPEELTELTDKSIEQFVGIFQRHPRYGVSDQAIRLVVDALPKNSVLAEVIAKVSIIKTLYATPMSSSCWASPLWSIGKGRRSSGVVSLKSGTD